MRIVWNPNPLLTVVELDDFDRKLLWHRVKIDCLEQMMGEAHFDLDPEHQEWCRAALGDRCPKDFVADARRNLDYLFVCGKEKRRDMTFDEYISAMAEDYAAELLQAHCGDCTCVASSCLKCRAEALVGVETIAGLGKHEAASLDFPRDRPATMADLDAAIDKALTYDGADAPDWGAPHVPRWVEEHRRAHAWLVSYRAEHFGSAIG